MPNSWSYEARSAENGRKLPLSEFDGFYPYGLEPADQEGEMRRKTTTSRTNHLSRPPCHCSSLQVPLCAHLLHKNAEIGRKLTKR